MGRDWLRDNPLYQVRPARFDDPTFMEVMKGKRTRDIQLPPEGKKVTRAEPTKPVVKDKSMAAPKKLGGKR